MIDKYHDGIYRQQQKPSRKQYDLKRFKKSLGFYSLFILASIWAGSFFLYCVYSPLYVNLFFSEEIFFEWVINLARFSAV